MTVEPLDLAQVDLRAEPDRLPFDAPAANTVATWSARDVLWLGPNEWLIVGDPGTEAAIADELESALGDHHRSVVDVGADRIVFDLEDALDRLAIACGLDLHPSRWTSGMCAQTLFGQAQVILQQRDERTTRVFVRPSFAGYVEQLLATA
jgi:sarcosine oxidase, subunit gamma